MSKADRKGRELDSSKLHSGQHMAPRCTWSFCSFISGGGKGRRKEDAFMAKMTLNFFAPYSKVCCYFPSRPIGLVNLTL